MKFLPALFILFLSFSVKAEDTNVFENVTVGFKVTKPNDWQFVTVKDNFDNLKKVKMDNQEFKQMMLKYSTAPLVAMMKHPEPFEDLNPSFKVNIKPIGQLKDYTPEQIVALIIPQFEKVFTNFVVVHQPERIKIGGLDAGYMKANYTLSTQDGKNFDTTSELWIVPRGDYFFTIGAGTRKDEKTGTREEISKIIESIQF
ncbi:MAG TPA: hypothetical protein PK055_08975 [Gammaproteobacteria bacterium]|nr:hypothetical protein [Xanthomonadales bacterium]HPI95757.1 hypothetical protein [Gammaproteobacteria bacterium]HPQ87776.1 hypothetical protein [Gammaproteobacteria bacterium]